MEYNLYNIRVFICEHQLTVSYVSHIRIHLGRNKAVSSIQTDLNMWGDFVIFKGNSGNGDRPHHPQQVEKLEYFLMK